MPTSSDDVPEWLKDHTYTISTLWADINNIGIHSIFIIYFILSILVQLQVVFETRFHWYLKTTQSWLDNTVNTLPAILDL
nr:peroxisome assembly protein 12-like [Biomphalaria glabrata]